MSRSAAASKMSGSSGRAVRHVATLVSLARGARARAVYSDAAVVVHEPGDGGWRDTYSPGQLPGE